MKEKIGLRTVLVPIGILLVTSCLSKIDYTFESTKPQLTSVVNIPSISRSPKSSYAPPSSPSLTPKPMSTSNPRASNTPSKTALEGTNTKTATITQTFGPIGQLHLKIYDLVMEYKRSRWQVSEPDEQGRIGLKHTVFLNCQVREFGPAHILGEFKYKLVLGQYTYSIYEYFYERDDNEVQVREYVIDWQSPAPTQTPVPTPIAKPYFLVTVPRSSPEACIVSVHVVLVTLHEPPTQ